MRKSYRFFLAFLVLSAFAGVCDVLWNEVEFNYSTMVIADMNLQNFYDDHTSDPSRWTCDQESQHFGLELDAQLHRTAYESSVDAYAGCVDEGWGSEN